MECEKIVGVDTVAFVDYLTSGWGISLICAIDFTASNRAYTDPNSLHNIY